MYKTSSSVQNDQVGRQNTQQKKKTKLNQSFRPSDKKTSKLKTTSNNGGEHFWFSSTFLLLGFYKNTEFLFKNFEF